MGKRQYIRYNDQWVDITGSNSVARLASAPATASDGDLYYNTTENKLYGRVNGAWENILVGDIAEVVAGNGLTGGASSGTATITVGAGTAITVDADSVNVQLTDSTSSTSTTTAATPASVKSAYDLAAAKVASVSGTGAISSTGGTAPVISVASASTTVVGAVQLTDATNSTSTTTAATPNSVKSAYDLANTANTTAGTAIPKNTVTAAGDLLYASGSATVTRLGVGSTDQVLVVASGAPSWAFKPKVVVNAQTGTTYTLALTDAGKMVEFNNASAITLTIPTNSTTAFPTWTQIDLLQTGAGTVTVGGAGVTLQSNGSKTKLNGQWAGATLIKRDTDTWVLIGNIAT